jgi:hypothetical protein
MLESSWRYMEGDAKVGEQGKKGGVSLGQLSAL